MNKVSDLIWKMLIKIRNMKRRVLNKLHNKEMRLCCIAHTSVMMMPESRVVNLSQNNELIRIGAGTTIRGEICDIYPWRNYKAIGDYCLYERIANLVS